MKEAIQIISEDEDIDFDKRINRVAEALHGWVPVYLAACDSLDQTTSTRNRADDRHRDADHYRETGPGATPLR